MLQALRISIGNITYDFVDLIEHQEIGTMGFPQIFEEETIMFRYRERWHTCHAYNLKLIQIDRQTRNPREGIEFDKIIIDSDKIYGPGTIMTRDKMQQYGIPIFWENGFEKQLSFTCRDGLFVTTDYAVDTIRYHKTNPYVPSRAVRSARTSQLIQPRVSKATVRGK